MGEWVAWWHKGAQAKMLVCSFPILARESMSGPLSLTIQGALFAKYSSSICQMFSELAVTGGSLPIPMPVVLSSRLLWCWQCAGVRLVCPL